MSIDQVQGCRGVFIGTLPSYTYNNGTGGVGATLTANSNGAFPVNDGVAYDAIGHRILIAYETSGSINASSIYNGIYELTTVGDGSNPWVLTRATDFDTAAQMSGALIFGTCHGDTFNQAIWANQTSVTTVGTDTLSFALLSNPQAGSNIVGNIIERQNSGQNTMIAGANLNTDPITNTQSPGDNSTKVATTAYADNSATTAATDINIAFSDVTNNNSSTSKHGFLKKLDNNSAHFMDGTGNWSTPTAPAAAQPHMSVFTSSGTLTTSANITSSTVFKFTIVGGGGGGGGATSSDGFGAAAGGGGAGATCIYEVSGLSPSTGYTINVGAAGSAGASAGGTGGTGGTSSAVIGGTTASATGGAGGVGAANAFTSEAGGAGGAASNGTINIPGGYGGNSATSGIHVTLAAGGNGGSSSMGGGGLGAIGTAVAAVAGQAYGSGGGGAVYNTSNVAGTAGKAGIVIVEWFE